MSIKIYDGLRGNIADPFELAKKMREVLEPVFFEAYGDLVAEARAAYKADGEATLHSIFDLDGKEWKKPIKHRLYIPKLVHQAIGALHRQDTWSFTELAIGYEVSLLPNGAGGNPLALVYGERRNPYTDLLLKAGVVESYGYWDNTDPEDDITEEEWELRREAWSPVFDLPPAQVGLSFSLPSSIEAEISLSRKA